MNEAQLSDLSREALEHRSGWDTRNGIPRKLKSLAYDLYGRDRCSLCGATTGLHLHHTAPEASEAQRLSNGTTNPYIDTEPWQLVPVCPSCHRKIENNNFNLINRALWWLALKKRGEYDASLEGYLEARLSDISEHFRTPLEGEFWNGDQSDTGSSGGGGPE